MRLAQAPFGQLPGGRVVDGFTLSNDNGVCVHIISLGGTITRLEVPDRAGRVADIVLGFDALEPYLGQHPHFGGIIGRYANRIASGRFELIGREYRLATNSHGHHIHGGRVGFDRVLWEAAPFEGPGAAGVSLAYVSPDGEEGYPGTLDVLVRYTLTAASELVLDYHARTDQATHANLTNHSYFNLAGAGNRDVLGHEVTIEADAYTPTGPGQIPTGEIAGVAETAFDLRRPCALRQMLGTLNPALQATGGFDHNFVLRDGAGERRAALVCDPVSGRTMEVRTTEPGIQLYTGNKLDGTITGKQNKAYGRHAGLCLETQHFPDTPNHPAFPSTVIRPGEPLISRTTYAFGTT